MLRHRRRQERARRARPDRKRRGALLAVWWCHQKKGCSAALRCAFLRCSLRVVVVRLPAFSAAPLTTPLPINARSPRESHDPQQAVEAALKNSGFKEYDPKFRLASIAYQPYVAKCETVRIRFALLGVVRVRRFPRLLRSDVLPFPPAALALRARAAALGGEKRALRFEGASLHRGVLVCCVVFFPVRSTCVLISNNPHCSSNGQTNTVDFDDMLCLAVELLEKCPKTRADLRSRWKFLFVDEFQDTSRVQYDFLRLLCGTGNAAAAAGARGGAAAGLQMTPVSEPGKEASASGAKPSAGGGGSAEEGPRQQLLVVGDIDQVRDQKRAFTPVSPRSHHHSHRWGEIS